MSNDFQLFDKQLFQSFQSYQPFQSFPTEMIDSYLFCFSVIKYNVDINIRPKFHVFQFQCLYMIYDYDKFLHSKKHFSDYL